MTLLREEVSGQIWVQERSVWYGGVRLRSRTTIVKMRDGKLLVHSPGETTAEACRELDALGEVAWIVVPNKFHHLETPALKEKYPSAKVVGPASALARNPAVVLDYELPDPEVRSQLTEFRLLPLAGVPFLDETLFFHEPSQTLIAADLLMCGSPKDHFTWRWASRIYSQYGKYKLPPDVRSRTKPSEELKSSLGELRKLPIQRILVAHSDAIQEQPLETLSAAWEYALMEP
jgi:hypothetical protein